MGSQETVWSFDVAFTLSVGVQLKLDCNDCIVLNIRATRGKKLINSNLHTLPHEGLELYKI